MPEHQQLSYLDLSKKLPKCKYGHPHMNRAAIEACEERTLRALCAQFGLDYESELKREPPRLPAGSVATQEELF